MTTGLDAMTEPRHRCALATAILCGCGAQASRATRPQTIVLLRLLPKLDVGSHFVFHVDVVVETDAAGIHDRGEMHLDDTVQVVSNSTVVERFSAVTPAGDGALGETFRRIAPILQSGSVTTRFDEHWHAIAMVEGTTDDEVRTMIMNLTPVVSFRMLPSGPMAVSEEWAAGWNESLRSDKGSPTGQVKTNVRYRLDSVATCGPRRCATIASSGSDAIPPHGTVSGTSDFDGRIVVDVADVVPISKTINSKTHLHGEQDGQPFDYTNTVRVDVHRSE